MEELLRLLTTYGAGLGALGAAIAFGWSVYQFFSVRSREAKSREFETYHRLIKELVEPPTESAVLYVDRQCAVVYELRFFPRYYPFTRRTLLGLQRKWSVTAAQYPRLLEEIDITLKFIEERSEPPLRRAARRLSFLHAEES